MRLQAQATSPAVSAAIGGKAVLVLEDGTVFHGKGLGAYGQTLGEVCFNTSMTGYQEILTDPSYAGQIITFTFPHIGNVGANEEDAEARHPACRGVVLREAISPSANWRALTSLHTWLKDRDLIGIAGVDTRRLASLIRDQGAPKGCLAFSPDGRYDPAHLGSIAARWPGLEGMDLTGEVSCIEPYEWTEGLWSIEDGHRQAKVTPRHVVCVDYGVKRNILRSLADLGCRVTVVPARSSTASILAHRPDGVFLSNGPGDPGATSVFAVPVIQELINSGIPIFGVCLGHQMLALALGGQTAKMHLGHRGANHPVQDLASGRVEITSQNHGFVVLRESLPASVEETHSSLFDGTLEGLRMMDKPVFSVQFHPEASPGPQDSHPLFKQFIALMDR
ncbi:MAG: glutamine-hydrolyzing carbamoyl-phosphate synthase small subunit [Dongiaceae bacterium]